MSDINYHAKYLKYKTKYLQLLNSSNISNIQFGGTGGTGSAGSAPTAATGACEKNEDCQTGSDTQCKKGTCAAPAAGDVVKDDLSKEQPKSDTDLAAYIATKTDATKGGTGATGAAGATGTTGRMKYSINTSFNIDDYLN